MVTEPQWTLRAFDDHSVWQWHEILTLRAEVFVVEQRCAYLDPDALDAKAQHLAGTRAGALVAYARLFPEGGHVRLGRIVTRASVRGTGLGRRLMTELLRRVGPQEAFMHAQTQLIPFYGAFGFVVEGDEFLEDSIPHVAMRRPRG